MSYISPIDSHIQRDGILKYSGGFGTTLGLKEELQFPLWSAAANFGDDGVAKLKGVHRQFRDVGAKVLSTNTFRMQRNRIQQAILKGALQGDDVALTELGVRNAMHAANAVKAESNGQLLVAGSYGPWGGTHERFQVNISPEDLLNNHREQANRIAKHNPDFLAPEAIPNLEEAIPMARAASEIFVRTGGRIPFVLGVSIEDSQTLYGGGSLREFVKQTDLPGRIGITFNCRPTEIIAGGLRNLVGYYDGFVGGYANGPGAPAKNQANWDHNRDPRAIKALAKEKADWTEIDDRVKIIGVCCGGSPEVVAAVGAELSARRNNPSAKSNSAEALEAPRPRSRLVASEPVGLAAASNCDCGTTHYNFG